MLLAGIQRLKDSGCQLKARWHDSIGTDGRAFANTIMMPNPTIPAQYAVMGNPIHHSWSPKIHQLFAEQTQQPIQYRPILVALDGFEQALAAFKAQGGKGLNITLPFKQQAYQLAHVLTSRARSAKAVNTLHLNSNGEWVGDNTDGVGFIRDVVHYHQFPLSNKRILILGAGGAVRGILDPILEEQPEWVVIFNRTAENANQLVTEFSHYPSIQTASLSQLSQFKFDLIINGTSASLSGETIDLPGHILGAKTYCYDMVYGKESTPFMLWAKNNHAGLVSDGLGMLVQQAAESFYIWRGIRPDVSAVLNYFISSHE